MATYQITSPDGKAFEVSAPDGTSQEDVLSYAKKKFGDGKEQDSQDGFVANVQTDLAKRNVAIQETMEAEKRGEIGSLQGATQAFGQVAGGALDVVGEGVMATGRGLSAITPDVIEEPIVEGAKAAWDWIANTDAGKVAGEAISGGVEKYGEWKAENPQEAKTLEGAANIGMLFAPVKVKANAKPSPLDAAAKALDVKANRQILKKRSDFVGDLISPKRTSSVKIAETSRTSEKGIGLAKRSVVELSPKEIAVANEIKNIPSVTNKKSIQGNLNAIMNENKRVAKQLEADVGSRKVLGIQESAGNKIDEAVRLMIKENPVITGNAENVARKVSTKAKEIIQKSPSTPRGMLAARKELDSWIKSQKGAKVFDPELEGALSVSVRSVRNAMNDVVEASTGTAAVKKELKRQRLMYDAIENLAPKAADESNYAIGRLLQNTAKALPYRRSFQTDVGMLMGLGVIGASETLAPIFAGGLAITSVAMGARKLAISSTVKKGLSRLIKTADRAIISSKQPSMIKQLRADRALILELMKTAEITDEQEE